MSEIDKIARSCDPFIGAHVAYGYFMQAWCWRFRLHAFLQAEPGEAFHDHPWDFWTFPLRSYVERVFNHETGAETVEVCRAFRLHWRPASYTHNYLGRWSGKYEDGVPTVIPGTVVTLAMRSAPRREWFYWRMNKGRLHRYSWLPYLRRIGHIPSKGPSHETASERH